MLHKPRRNPDFVFRNVADECLLVPIAREASELGSIYALNEVGGFVWHLLDGEHDLGALVDAVLAEFDVEREEAEVDLRELLTELASLGAVVD